MDNPQNSDSFADELDKIIPSGSRDIINQPDQADPLVNAALRLANAPVPHLSSEALARIEAKIGKAHPVVRPSPIQYRLAVLGAVAAIVLLGGIVTVIASNQNNSNITAFNRTSTASVEPSATNSPQITSDITVSAVPPEPTNTVTATAVPGVTFTETPIIVIPTMTSTLIITERPAATSTDIAPVMTIVPSSTTSQAVAIILEGPVEKIEDNQLFIYGIRIELAPDDPLLKVLRIEDYVRIEGEVLENTDELVIVVQSLIFENPQPQDNEVYINPEGNDAWRDSGDCTNPPPSWAPANGWRTRCENQQQPGNSGGQNNSGNSGNNGNGGNNGMGDDDDGGDDD